MSETSRKRSRKSKLVPRQITVSEDEFDIELQIPPAKQLKTKRQYNKKVNKSPEPTPEPEEEYDTSVLKKINASAKEDTEQKSKSPRKFEINIEVETCDDEEDVDKKFEDYVIHDKETLKKPETICPIPIVLTRDIVLKAADEILKTSTNIADKILNINVRNTIGHEQPQILNPGWLEIRIQDALEEWRTWQFRSFHREDPLFYKCYICTRSYWYLSEFRDHMSETHPNDVFVSIGLEKYEMHEANVIAYHKKLIVIKDIYTPGLCYRCGKDYNAHELDLRQQRRYYISEGCSKHFFSCMGLRDHFPWCIVCKEHNKPIKCEICKSRFDTEDDLTDHLVLSHSVRSDIPIMVRYKYCKVCEQRYSCGFLHKCDDECAYLECPHCSMRFSSTKVLDSHLERSITAYQCEICQVIIEHGCQKYNHMLEHTDKYMLVKKCVECEGLKVFLSNNNALAHRALKHEDKDEKQPSTFPNILIPSSCLGSIAKPETIPTNQTVPEVQDLVSISEDSIPESEGSVPAFQKKLMEEDYESETEFAMGNVKVKEEPVDPEVPENSEGPEDSQDSQRLVIKEEFEEVENEIFIPEYQTKDFEHQINVKQEVKEEPEEYEEDIIKLDFDIEDLLIKQESAEEEEDYILVTSDESQEQDNDENLQSPEQKKKEESVSEADIESKKHKRSYRCSVCGYTANHRLYRTHMEYDCGKNSKKNYTCTKCDKSFVSLKKYLVHFAEHGFKHLSCPRCVKQFGTYSILAQHFHTHVKQNFIRVKLITSSGTSKPDHQCRICGETVEIKDFFKHWELHLTDRPVDPVEVERPAEDKMHEMKIKESIARLSKQPKECNHCHHRFKRINECKRHIIEHLLVDAYKHRLIFKVLRCQICEIGFNTPERYKQHMRDHASLPVYKCELCDRTFSDSSNFTKHKKVHNLKVLVCDLCGKKFQCKSSLEKHMEKHNVQAAKTMKACREGKPHESGCLPAPKHQTTEPITCKLCNKIFYFETCYRRHVRYFHEKANLGFRCIICNERFDNLKLKWDHMWEVHQERKQKADCPICHKSFRKYADVRAHARADHGTEISVLSLKEGTNTTININKYLKQPPLVQKVRRVETLVVYDSD